MRTILVTGAAGFIGSNFVRMVASRGESVKLIAFDKLSYAGNLANIQDIVDGQRVVFRQGRHLRHRAGLCDLGRAQDQRGRETSPPKRTWIAAFLIRFPSSMRTFRGTQVLLDVAAAKKASINSCRFGTDEVYGTLPEDDPSSKFHEEMPMLPNSPYRRDQGRCGLPRARGVSHLQDGR